MNSQTKISDEAGVPGDSTDMSVNPPAMDDLKSLLHFGEEWDSGSAAGSCARKRIENLYNLPHPERFLQSSIFAGRYFGQMILKYCPHSFRDDLAIVLALLLEPTIDGKTVDAWRGIAEPKAGRSWRTLCSEQPTGILTATRLAETFLENYEVRAREWVQKHCQSDPDETDALGADTTATSIPAPPGEEYKRHDFWCHSFKIASPRLRSHKALALWVIQQHQHVASYCGSDLRDDLDFIQHAMQLVAGPGCGCIVNF